MNLALMIRVMNTNGKQRLDKREVRVKEEYHTILQGATSQEIRARFSRGKR